jgi:hypothetical protein
VSDPLARVSPDALTVYVSASVGLVDEKVKGVAIDAYWMVTGEAPTELEFFNPETVTVGVNPYGAPEYVVAVKVSTVTVRVSALARIVLTVLDVAVSKLKPCEITAVAKHVPLDLIARKLGAEIVQLSEFGVE